MGLFSKTGQRLLQPSRAGHSLESQSAGRGSHGPLLPPPSLPVQQALDPNADVHHCSHPEGCWGKQPLEATLTTWDPLPALWHCSSTGKLAGHRNTAGSLAPCTPPLTVIVGLVQDGRGVVGVGGIPAQLPQLGVIHGDDVLWGQSSSCSSWHCSDLGEGQGGGNGVPSTWVTALEGNLLRRVPAGQSVQTPLSRIRVSQHREAAGTAPFSLRKSSFSSPCCF